MTCVSLIRCITVCKQGLQLVRTGLNRTQRPIHMDHIVCVPVQGALCAYFTDGSEAISPEPLAAQCSVLTEACSTSGSDDTVTLAAPAGDVAAWLHAATDTHLQSLSTEAVLISRIVRLS